MLRLTACFCLVAALAVTILFSCLSARLQDMTAPVQPPARNIILMIGDGMGFNHITAASLYNYGLPGHFPP